MRVFMGLERIYFELKKREDDEYYIELAQKDVLFVPVITDIMLNNSNSMSIWAQMILEKISVFKGFRSRVITVFHFINGYGCRSIKIHNDIIRFLGNKMLFKTFLNVNGYSLCTFFCQLLFFTI